MKKLEFNRGIAVFGVTTLLVLITTLLIISLTVPVARDTITLTFLEKSKEGRFMSQGAAEYILLHLREGDERCGNMDEVTVVATHYRATTSFNCTLTATTTLITSGTDMVGMISQFALIISSVGVPHSFVDAVHVDDGVLELSGNVVINGNVHANNLIMASGSARINGSTTAATKFATSTFKSPRYGQIQGDVALGFNIGTSTHTHAFAQYIKNVSVTGALRCNPTNEATSSYGNNKACDTASSTYVQPYTRPLVFYPAYLQHIKDFVMLNGEDRNSLTYSSTTISLPGITYVNGNVTLSGTANVRVGRVLWVTGDLTMSSASRITRDPTAYGESTLVVVEGEINLNGGASTSNSPSATSTNGITLVSLSRCPYAGGCGGGPAVSMTGSSTVNGVLAPYGTFRAISGNPSLNYLVASSAILGDNASVNWDRRFRNVILPTASTTDNQVAIEQLLPINQIDFR